VTVRGRVALAIVVAIAGCASAPLPAKPFSMRVYQMAFLSAGPRYIAEDTPERKKLLEGHQANIRRLAADGKLLIAGPLDWPGDDKDAIVGIFIFDAATKEEAEALCATDPTIAAGHFAARVVPWYGPSGLTYDGRDEELAKIRAGTAMTPTLPK
jgi:uncharacterized protein YciI